MEGYLEMGQKFATTISKPKSRPTAGMHGTNEDNGYEKFT